MSVEESDQHPSAMTEEQKEKLRKLVEEEEAELGEGEDGGEEAAAGKQDDGNDDDGDGKAGDQAGDAAAAAGKGDKPAAKATAGDDGGDGEGAASAAAKDGKGEAGKDGTGGKAGEQEPPEGYVSRKQYDGVLSELREVRTTVSALKAASSGGKLEPLPERDFDKEDAALDAEEASLDKRYDDGMPDEEYRAEQRALERKRRALDRDRNKYELHAALLQSQAASEERSAEQIKQEQEAAWKAQLDEWQAGLGDWLKNPVRRATVSQTMEMMNADPELSKLDNDGYLAKLDEFLADAFPNYPRKGDAPPGDGTSETGATSAGGKPDARQVLSARRAAEVTGAPQRMEGGVGNRGTGAEDIDLSKVPLGKFSQLPKAKQDELLGID